ncbi:hypothetical protein MC378_10350 [Polaribacter sp. MSW13]|uniref:Uncharacterized protein n=1 Tax=Polaribacter marinus TaxID=2916838 RepID=A0A9X1VPS4_9FLAO|nr:hypothetical protein [Polaribacter marinus]MCI2229568.1 hypothetical protein [Polaribacter marinus]
MKQELTKNQKTIGTIILIIAIVFLYKFYQSENAPAEKVVAKEIKIAPFFTMQQNEDELYTPENYLLDYYANVNTKDWNYLLKHSLRQYNLDYLQGHFETKEFVGVKILSTEKMGKELAYVKTNVTYINAVNDTIAVQVNAHLQLATDYKTWIVAPLTVF